VVKNPNSFEVTEEWIQSQVQALDAAGRRQQFTKLRSFPSSDQLLHVLPDLGWYPAYSKWVIPVRNIDGECLFVKAWTHDPGTKPDGTQYEKWITIGGDKASAHARQGKPTGQLFNLHWIFENYHHTQGQQLPWLWMTAGEFDCLMLRCNGWLATTSTTGEGSSLSVDFFIREFNGLANASAWLSGFSGIVLCYDCDDTGVRGMQRHAALLDQFFEQINKAALDPKSGVLPLPGTFIGVKAVDLRQHPHWEAIGKKTGWDLTDLARWSRENNGEASKWLKLQVAENAAGVKAISNSLGLDYNDNVGTPTIGEILVVGERFKTMSFAELLRSGVSYTKLKGSRNEGWYHMAVVAARNGWTMEELWYQDTDNGDDDLGPLKLFERLQILSRKLWPDKKDMPEEEVRRCFERAFLNYKQSAFVLDDTANMLRFFHYFPQMRYHPSRGWMFFNGKTWVPGRLRAVENATQLGGLIMEEANNIASEGGDAKLVAALRRWARQSRNSGKVYSLLHIASDHPLGRPNSDTDGAGGWDRDPWLLGTVAGVFDLKAGKLLSREQSLNAYCSMSTVGTIDERGWDALLGLPDGVENNLGHWARLWDSVVKSWFDAASEIAMLQEIGGTCLLGRLIQKLFVFESSGRSGKSLCLTAWSSALGPYAGVMLGSVMGSRSTDNAKSSAMAGIDATRMVRIDEMGSIAIDVEMLKSVTGEKLLAGRALRENWSAVRNMATYVGTANGTLNLSRDVTEALRSRIVYVRWPHTFVDKNLILRADYRNDGSVRAEDPSLGDILGGYADSMSDLGDLGGIDSVDAGMGIAVATAVLTWMYDGLRRMVARDGLGVTVAVTDTALSVADQVWAENNVVRTYFEESGLWRPLREGEEGTLVATDGLRQKMIEWAKLSGDTELVKQLERGPRVLSAMLQKQRASGFVSSGAMVSGALWQPAGKVQVRAWTVPYKFIAI
jgi:phage/plasmid-associated DNA primase